LASGEQTKLGAPAPLRRRPPATQANSPGGQLVRFLLTRSAPAWQELLAVVVLLSGTGALVYASHIQNGGLYSDDWAFASVAENAGSPFQAFDSLDDVVGFRPLGVISLVARFTLLGEHTKWHMAVVLASTVLLCSVIYLFLRTLRTEPVHAGAMALLVLVCPYADATRLWATGSGANLAISAWLLGVVLALRGLETTDRRKAIALHAAAVTLYLVSLLQYEIAYAAIVGTGLLYLTRAPWRRVLPRSAVDIGVASVAIAVIAANAAIQHAPSYSHHAKLMLEGGLKIFAAVALPYGTPRTATVLGLLGAVALGAGIVAWLLPRRAAEQRELVRWLVFAAGGLVLAVAGYVMFVGAIEYYSPLTPGLANRTNAIASIGFIGAVYAGAVLAGTLLFRGLPGGRPLAAATAMAVAGFLFVGYQDRVRDSAAVWDRAYAQEQVVLGAVRTGLPELPSQSVVLTFGHPTVSENPGLPIFSSPWELRSAVQVVYDDPSLAAYPALPDSQVACEPDGAHFTGGGYDATTGAEYGRVYLLDVASGRVQRLRSRRECRAATPQFLPGPPQAPAPAP
jgi:hypothetical protein